MFLRSSRAVLLSLAAVLAACSPAATSPTASTDPAAGQPVQTVATLENGWELRVALIEAHFHEINAMEDDGCFEYLEGVFLDLVSGEEYAIQIDLFSPIGHALADGERYFVVVHAPRGALLNETLILALTPAPQIDYPLPGAATP